MSDFGHLPSPVIAFFEVADVLIDETRVFLFLLSILEDLGMLAHLDEELIVTLNLSALFEGAITFDLEIDMSIVVESLTAACKMVERSRLDLEASFTRVA